MDNVTFCGITDLGCVRTNNEDAYIVQYIWDKEHILAVAIDGVGGYEGGEVASALARDTIVEYLEQYPNGERLDLLKQAVIQANNVIFEQRREQPQYAQMSCVLTAALVELKMRRVNMAHVGDTRLYQFTKDGGILKLSHDHSLVGYREEIGQLSEWEAMHHPQRNLISRDVGSNPISDDTQNEYVETATFPLHNPSMLLLCSDGLTDMITSLQICDVLSAEEPVEQKAQRLVDEAKAAGGKDNVTVVLVDVQLTEAAEKPTEVVAESKEPAEPKQTEESKEPVEPKPIEVPKEPKWAKQGSKVRLWPIVLALMVGYLLGGYTGHNWLPQLGGSNEKPVAEPIVSEVADTLKSAPDTIEVTTEPSVAEELPTDSAEGDA